MINVPCLNCDDNATSKKFMEIVNSSLSSPCWNTNVSEMRFFFRHGIRGGGGGGGEGGKGGILF